MNVVADRYFTVMILLMLVGWFLDEFIRDHSCIFVLEEMIDEDEEYYFSKARHVVSSSSSVLRRLYMWPIATSTAL